MSGRASRDHKWLAEDNLSDFYPNIVAYMGAATNQQQCRYCKTTYIDADKNCHTCGAPK